MCIMEKLISAFFTRSGVPQTGLTPTIDIYHYTATVNTQVVTGAALTEIAAGFYKYEFTTFDPKEAYVFLIDGGTTLIPSERYLYGGNEAEIKGIASEVWEEVAADHVVNGTTGDKLSKIHADTQAISVSVATAISLLETLIKYERNRTKIDKTAGTLTVYDDDGTTAIRVFDLKDDTGVFSVTEITERVPV
jgi:hypothetical protein